MSSKIGFLLEHLKALPTGDLSPFWSHAELEVLATGFLSLPGGKGMSGKGRMSGRRREDGFETGVGKNVDCRSDTKVHGPSRIVNGREPAESGERKEG